MAVTAVGVCIFADTNGKRLLRPSDVSNFGTEVLCRLGNSGVSDQASGDG